MSSRNCCFIVLLKGYAVMELYLCSLRFLLVIYNSFLVASKQVSSFVVSPWGGQCLSHRFHETPKPQLLNL